MKNEDWKRVEHALREPYGHAVLMCDGYKLTLSVFYTKMRLEIGWHVNGRFRMEWLTEDTDIRRRFARPVMRRVYKRKNYSAAFKKAMKREGVDLDETRLVYYWSWQSPVTLVRHLKKTCQAVALLEINHCPMEETDAQVPV
jgi:hypothetical protein